jgi:uncharacterized protein (UPF0333 family)
MAAQILLTVTLVVVVVLVVVVGTSYWIDKSVGKRDQ